MAATELLCRLIGIDPAELSKEENLILEAELFARLYDEMKEFIKVQYKDYFRLMKFTIEMENTMIEANFIRYLINDILTTEEYSLNGIAYYTNSPEDVIAEIATGQNTNPSFSLSRNIIELHRNVRNNIYQSVIKKISGRLTADDEE